MVHALTAGDLLGRYLNLARAWRLRAVVVAGGG